MHINKDDFMKVAMLMLLLVMLINSFIIRLKDNDWGIAAFACRESLRSLAATTTCFMDGTFHTAPKPYKQFFTIHGLVSDRVIPLVYVLMQDKTTGAYRQVT